VAAADRIAAHTLGMDGKLAFFYVVANMQSNINTDVLSQILIIVSLSGLLCPGGKRRQPCLCPPHSQVEMLCQHGLHLTRVQKCPLWDTQLQVGLAKSCRLIPTLCADLECIVDMTCIFDLILGLLFGTGEWKDTFILFTSVTGNKFCELKRARESTVCHLNE